jgi:hypothetical protein
MNSIVEADSDATPLPKAALLDKLSEAMLKKLMEESSLNKKRLQQLQARLDQIQEHSNQ